MDAMALLCNLHADGPSTLRLLRRSGVKTLSDVRSVQAGRLADLLGSSPAAARRFAREAGLLASRISGATLEPEEDRPREDDDEPAVAAGEAFLTCAEKSHAAERESASPARIVPPLGTLLRPGLVEGLDAETCNRLVSHGVRTLESLAEAPGLALARRIKVPLPRLLDLEWSARASLGRAGRELEAPPHATPEPEPVYVLHPQGPLPAGEDVAGPFA